LPIRSIPTTANGTKSKRNEGKNKSKHHDQRHTTKKKKGEQATFVEEHRTSSVLSCGTGRAGNKVIVPGQPPVPGRERKTRKEEAKKYEDAIQRGGSWDSKEGS